MRQTGSSSHIPTITVIDRQPLEPNDNVNQQQQQRRGRSGSKKDTNESKNAEPHISADEIADKEAQTSGGGQTAAVAVATLVQLDDFVGEHGPYQLSITALLFIRYVLLGLMANSGPLMTPDVTFYCELPRQEILMIMPNISKLSEREQAIEIREEFKQICQIDLHLYQNASQLNNVTTKSQSKTTPLIVAAGQQKQHQHQQQQQQQQLVQNVVSYNSDSGGRDTSPPASGEPARIRECTDFTYQLAQDQGLTMTSEFDLVCDQDWLRSLFQSLISASIVVAHVIWGTFSDKYGRFQAQRICLVISLGAGIMSIFAPDFWTFTLTRAVCSFGDLGMVVSLTTVVVELVGSKYRGTSVALVNFGYALGVSLLPYVVAYFENFRQVVGFTVLCHMITMPFVLATNESIRWLLTNRKFDQARKELKRIARWNRSCRDLWSSIGWPWASEKATSQTEPAMAGEKVPGQRSAAQAQRKETFELKFKEFVEQIESQNLYDPTVEVERASKQQQQHQRQRLDLPTISVSDPMRSTLSPNSPSNGQQSVWRPIEVDTSIRRSNDDNSRPEDTTSSPGASVAQMRRSISCGHLLDSGTVDVNKDGSTDTGDGLKLGQIDAIGDKDERLSQLDIKMKRLTLPQMSRDSSVYGDGEPDDDGATIGRRNHLIRRYPGCQQQPDCINLVAHQLSFVGRVSRLFRDKKLMIAVFTIVWTTFNSELLYTSFIIINLEVGEDVYLNYVLGGCMEALAAIMASLLLSYSPRRVSLIAFWLLISLSCFGLSLAHIDSTWAVWMLALAKFSQSSLSSIASVAAYESFPTFLRQSGSGLVFTLGMLGSVFAPLIFAEFDDHAGMDRVLMTFSCSSLTAAILIYLFLNETRNCELM